MSFIKRLNFYMKLAGGWEIARRYFVMNGFDGVLTIFAVVLTAFFLHECEPSAIIATGFGASIAIGISGFWIAYLTEEAEQDKEKKQIEAMIFTNLDNTSYAKAAKIASAINSFIDGFSPFMFGMIILSPFFLVTLDVLTMSLAYNIAFIIAFSLLIILGMLLGKIAKSNMYVFAAKTVMAGIMVGIFIFLVEVLPELA